MEIEKLIVGQLQTNCYLAWDKKSKEAVIIDPGDAGDFIIRRIQDLGLKPKFILATHGHFDHLLAATELKLAFNIPFLMNKNDLFLLKRMQKTAKHFTGVVADPAPPVDQFLKDGDVIRLGQEKLKVLETPGHSPGGVVFYSRGLIFTGDTLFTQGIGRTDFSYGSREKLLKSIKKIFRLPKKTIVYPGHSDFEKLENIIKSKLAI